MNNLFNNKFLIALTSAVLIGVSACSSSTSSSSGRGQIPTGIYTGVLNGQNNAQMVTSDNAQLSIIASENSTTDTDDDGNSTTTTSPLTVTGDIAFTGSNVPNIDRCFLGGTVSGSVVGDQMSLTITLEASTTTTTEDGDTMTTTTGAGETISMTGRVTDDTYEGTFNATDSGCGRLSGGFEFRR